MYLELYKAYTANFSKKRTTSKLTGFMVGIHLKYLRLELFFEPGILNLGTTFVKLYIIYYSGVVELVVTTGFDPVASSVHVQVVSPLPFVKETYSNFISRAID